MINSLRTNPQEKPFSDFSDASLTVGDIKQFAYCHRIPYFTGTLGIKPRETFLMKHGALEEKIFDKRQRRHTLTRFSLAEGVRCRNVTLSSQKLGLTGKADLIIEGGAEVVVVDFKSGRSGPFENHNIQLACYGLLAEERFGKPCLRGFLFYAANRRWVEVRLETSLRERTTLMISEARQARRRQDFPEPTPYEVRCPHCEFINFCGDRR